METLQETLQGIRIVKAFTLEDTMRERFDRNVAAVEHEANKMARVSNRSSPLMETLGGCAIAIAITYSGYRVIETGATPGQFFSFIAAFLLAYEPAKRLARLNIELNSGLVGVRILFEVIDSPPSEPSDDGKPALRIKTPRLEFDDVHFAYRQDEAVLNGLSLVAEPGKLTALVGPSGGGKSTVFNLILRFYDAERGKIVVDGQDVTQVSRRSLRQHIAYVGQDVFLFRGTIRENIAFGKPGASEEEIVAAAKGAYAHDFIMSFPRGYDTPVGEHGLQLSGGQRQRVAIARALIKNAPIILLDEATAALDSESELAVREAMEILCRGRTTLAIAHRLHTVSHADRIYVLESGRVTESGQHEELAAQERPLCRVLPAAAQAAGDAGAGRSGSEIGAASAAFFRLVQVRGMRYRMGPPAIPAIVAIAKGNILMSADYVIPPPPQATIAVAGSSKVFPVRRIWCVGRNYIEHIREMGQDERLPPFYFAKPADAIVPDGGTVPYPSLTKDMHHEVELVVALKSGGRNIPVAKANDCIYGYAVGIDLTRRDLQIASRDLKRPWEIGKAFDHSAPCGALVEASKIGHPTKGKITLKCNGTLRQDGDLNQLIWNVPEIISNLSEMVELVAGDIIMTGTPSGVAATVAGDKLECEVEGVGTLTVTIGPPLK